MHIKLLVILISSVSFCNLTERAKAEDISKVEILKADLEWRYCPTEKPIKGNVNYLKDTKIYHTPAGAMYKRTNPEACFANTQEAEEAGFRRSLR